MSVHYPGPQICSKCDVNSQTNLVDAAERRLLLARHQVSSNAERINGVSL